MNTKQLILSIFLLGPLFSNAGLIPAGSYYKGHKRSKTGKCRVEIFTNECTFTNYDSAGTHSYKIDWDKLDRIRFSEDEKLLLICKKDGPAELFDTSNWTLLHTLEVHTKKFIWDVRFDEHNNLLLDGVPATIIE